MADPSILHVDMDAFFVSVELLDQPELRGRPVIVGGASARGVVAAASYEARAYGVHSAMPSVRAKRLCPDAVFLSGRYERYVAESEEIMAIFGSFTPLVEPLSLDEAFLDVGGSLRLHGPAPTIADAIRRRVQDERGLTCSVGVAPTKFVAKLASEAAKPVASTDGPRPGLGVKVVTDADLFAFLHPLPVQALWGVGPATLAKLERLGVSSVGELAAMPLTIVISALGSSAGAHLHQLALGIDDRRVEPNRRAKSIGHEETFVEDRRERADLDRELLRFADAIGTRLRANGVAGRTITLKVRFGDFRTITRSATLADATESHQVILREARRLLDQVDPSQGVRLLGISVSGLTTDPARQLSLDDAGGPDWTEANRALDEIRARFGASMIGPAAIVEPDGLKLKTKGNQQWGPDDRGIGAENPDRGGGT